MTSLSGALRFLLVELKQEPEQLASHIEQAETLILMAASKGIAGVPRASLVVVLATAGAVQLPTAPILLILGVDTLMDMGRTAMNVIGNCLAAVVVGRWEGQMQEPGTGELRD